MASTYFHGGNSEIQSSADGLQTLYLMNPTYVPYSDTTNHPTTPNMFLLNPSTTPNAGHALNLPNLPHAPHPSHHNHTLLGLIPPNILGSDNHTDITAFHGLATTAPRVNYNLWGSSSIIDHQTPSPPAAATPSSNSGGAAASGFRRPSQQGLSLSLSSQQTAYNRSLSGDFEVPGQRRAAGVSPTSRGGEDMQIMEGSPSSMASNGVSSMQSSVILGSKYLKAAQELLDEVVSVGKGNRKGETIEMEGGRNKEKMKGNRSESECGGNNNIDDGGSSGGHNKQAAELSTAHRQELQMKKSKLVSMLDEVEQRYRQYRHQMQTVISSFEQVAGYGAAKSYTALALKTISKQFRCLKDAISSQIKATSKTLGEEDCLGVKVEGCRLRYVDHHLRQQRALQQLGMMHHNAWRPQRGLPERAVSILRAWLFEHFLHPYPKDSDKVLLAKQTGLTRSQVSNWFINARVRLWKPMVEEMYLEETKEQEQNNGSSNSKDNTNRSLKESTSKEANNAASLAQSPGPINIRSFDDQIKALQSKTDQTFNINQNSTSLPEISNSPMGVSSVHHSSNHLSVDVEMKPRDIKDAYNNPLIGGGGGGYVGFSLQDIGRFNVNNVSDQQLAPRFHGNSVSLTLGLPHSDNLPLSATQHGFLSHNNMHLGTNSNGSEFCAISNSPHPPPSPHSGTTTTYENIGIQNRKSFAAQLLQDFVA